MVLVAVGDDPAPDLVSLVQQVCDVGDDEVDAQHLVLGEHQAAVDEEDLLPALEGHHVLADLAQATERDDFEDGLSHGRRSSVANYNGGVWVRFAILFAREPIVAGGRGHAYSMGYKVTRRRRFDAAHFPRSLAGCSISASWTRRTPALSTRMPYRSFRRFCSRRTPLIGLA